MMQRRQKIVEARERIKRKLDERRSFDSQKKATFRPPRYDEVYERGVAWLDSLAES